MDTNSDDFSAEKLICEESFQQYCLGFDTKSRIYWEEWIKTHPHRLDDFKEAKRLFHILSAKQGSKLNQLYHLREGIVRFEDFQNNFTLLTSKEESEFTKVSIKPIYKYIGLVAACILIFLTVFLYNTSSISKKSSGSLAFSSGTLSRKTVFLSDGSIITLRKNSEIIISPNFNNSTREVWLKGEGFFDVEHSPLKPFIVHAGTNNIRVLGTVFNVKAYPNASYSETSLLEGIVKVTSDTDPNLSVILKPNYKFITTFLTITNEPNLAVSPVFQVLNMVGKNKTSDEVKWVRNRMDIEDESLEEIANRLKKWYGVEIEFGDKEVKKYRYSGVFENESIIKSLEALQLSYHFNFKIEDDKIIIKKQNRNQ